MRNFKKFLRRKRNNTENTNNLQHRFIIKVLLPPFIILSIIGAVVLWQVDSFFRNQAISELNRAATTTSAKIEREFALRQTILKRTGDDLFVVKQDYASSKEKLEADRTACSQHLGSGEDFLTAPGDACYSFLPEFATQDPSQQAVEDGYIKHRGELLNNQSMLINDRLAAYKQFFPETLALFVFDAKSEVISSALSEVLNDSEEKLTELIRDKNLLPIEGKQMILNDVRLATFAYPISEGSVLVAYNIDSNSFLRETWESTPIDTSNTTTFIVDSEGNIAYPNIEIGDGIKNELTALTSHASQDINLKDINHIATAASAGSSDWFTIVASPKSAVLAPVRDAQIIALLVIGLLLIGFLWASSFFIKKTVRNIIRLVGGALIFGGGILDYTIKLDDADIEFVKLAETLNSMAKRIASAEKEIDEKNKEFISIATHELRTPLTAVIGNLSMVREDMGDKIDDTVKPFIEQVYDSTIRLRDLINDMLDVARLEGGRTEFNLVPQDLRSIAQGVVEDLAITAQQNNINLAYNDASAAPVQADESRLRVVLNNFVSNAIKYNRHNGSITISHTLQNGMIVTSVADTGLGIPEEQKAHMFEKFFRVDHEDRKHVVGTGLGMYITKEYVEKMGGQVWFESIHGQGTTFYFSLPSAHMDPEQSIPSDPAPTNAIS